MPIASKPEIVKKSPTEVEEVKQFLDAFQRLEVFKQQHAAVFSQYEQLVAEYNQKLDNAEKICRAQKVSCGPFDLYNYSTKYDAKTLYDLVGHEQFLQVGGSTKTETVYVLDKTKVEIAIQQGRINQDVVESFKKSTPTFHKPEKLVT